MRSADANYRRRRYARDPLGAAILCRPVMPGSRIIAALLAPTLDDEQRDYVHWIIKTCVPDAPEELPAFAVNNAFRSWGHLFLYDQSTLADALTRTGFVEVRRFPIGESDDEDLRGLEGHLVAEGLERLTRFETMVLEAVRP